MNEWILISGGIIYLVGGILTKSYMMSLFASFALLLAVYFQNQEVRD